MRVAPLARGNLKQLRLGIINIRKIMMSACPNATGASGQEAPALKVADFWNKGRYFD
jgi:hypothetical protein